MGVTNGMVIGLWTAKHKIVEAGFGPDIEWAESLAHVPISEYYVMREYAWVVLNSGFRYSVARKLWPALTVAFKEWEPYAISAKCIKPALAVLNHRRKIESMERFAALVRTEGITRIVADAKEPLKLTRLPYIGKITCWHLAKLLGADVAKPDVHLQRAAAACSMTVEALCTGLARELDTRITVVDSILWRYGEQRAAHGWDDWPDLFSMPQVKKKEARRG